MPHKTRWSNFRSSFQFKLFLIFTLLTFVITSLLSTLYVVSETHEARRIATERLQLQAKYLADSVRLPLYAENVAALQGLAEQAARAQEIRAVVITATDGRIVAGVHAPEHSDTGENLVQTAEVYSNPLVDSVESALTGEHKIAASLIGSVRMERGTADLSRSVTQVVVLSTCIAIAFWLTVSLLCYLLLKRLTNSFNALVGGISKMQEGDYSTRIAINSNDEATRASIAVNNLADELQKRGDENSRLQEERLELERQMLHAQKLESLGIMAGGIAHDFNNLLQSILGNIELAALKLDPGSAPMKFIRNAVNSGKRAAHLTDLMLAYTGKRFIAKKGLDLNELVSENVEMLKGAATSAVAMELQLATELPFILADEANIQQIVMNLITNAAESIDGQPAVIKVTTGVQNCDQPCLAASLLEIKPPAGKFVFLEVRDNGCGMSRETLARIFDPFFTTKFTGRGLGMSAVMGIIKAHNGALFVESEPGKGTTFRVLFPAMEAAPEEVAPLPHPHPDASTQLMTSLTLGAEGDETTNLTDSSITPAQRALSGLALVVDDEKSVLKVCAKMVELCGYTVITATDGVGAVATFREQAGKISVVLMDLTMPNMDGISAMEEIYKIDPVARVILASGFTEDELSGRITGQPPAGFIRKPYNMMSLVNELRRVPEGKN